MPLRDGDEPRLGDVRLGRHHLEPGVGSTGRSGGGASDQTGIHSAPSARSKKRKQPVGGLNVGAIEVELDGDLARLNFKLFGEDEDTPGEPKLLFESGFE